MFLTNRIIFLFLLLLAVEQSVCGQEGVGRQLIVSELLRAGGEKAPVQTVQFELARPVRASVSVRAYQLRGERDSILAYAFETAPFDLAAGVCARTWKLDAGQKHITIEPGFEAVVKRFGVVPPGRYVIYTDLMPEGKDGGQDGGAVLSSVSSYAIDSNLAPASKLRARVNKAFGAGTKQAEAILQKSRGKKSAQAATAMPVEEATGSGKLRAKLRGVGGIATRTVQKDGVLQTELHYEGWFLGRYPLADTRQMTAKAEAEYQTLKANAASHVQNELEGFRSVGAQVRELYAGGQPKELQGDIDLAFSSATGRDPYSRLDPTYAEVRAALSTEIKDIPVAIEGYYTTQDMGRQARASYLRIRYDAQKAKDKLLKLISGYQSKFGETAAKGSGLEQVYGSYRDNLEAQATGLLSGMGREYGLDPSVLAGGPVSSQALQEALARKMDTATLIRQATAKANSKTESDSAATAVRDRYAAASRKLKEGEAAIRKKQEQYASLKQKTEKYTALLAQYKTQLHLDSALNYAKLQQLQNRDASYKDMAKAAEGLLPDGRVKKAVTGLTHLEAGILDRYESEYTLAGQTLKGASGGYDLGFGSVGLTAGFTEYVNREGVLDRYFGYLARIDVKEKKGQKLGLVYYSYSPTRQIIRSSSFAGNPEVGYPTFARPVQVISLQHSGVIGKQLHWQTEAATSLQAGTPQQTVGMDNAAIKTAAEYALPVAGLMLKGEWEHLGKAFENRSLPLARAGTDRYTAGVSGEFFRSFLHLGVTLNYLEQQNLSTTGYSTRWGFEARTRSKRYPNVQLAYKPFSTFRALSDTMAVSQRPLFGEVWLARGSYQLKRQGGLSHRFTLSYNQNSTTTDTASYRSVTAQAGYIYADKRWMISGNCGWMELPTVVADGYSTGASWFAGATAARAFGRLAAHAGQDVGYAPFGLQRLSTTAGASYRLQKASLTVRATLRYTHYRQDAASASGNLLAFQLGFGWRFAVPLSDKEEKI